jgi:nicotinamidase-related amidase
VSRLVQAHDSVLLVIDVQPGFVDRVEPELADGLVERIGFLAASAGFCSVPVIATVERPEDWGNALVAPEGAVRKETFGAGDDPDVVAAIAATGRGTAVLCGLETDVCVSQSALSLLDRGFEVICVADCVASPGSAHGYGLERMRAAGVAMLCAKQLHYEWVRTVPAARAFHAAHPDLTEPPGVLL